MIGPGQSSALGPKKTQQLTGIKLLMSIKLNIYLLYWYFQQSQCLNIKYHAIHNIPMLEWGPWVTAHRAHAFRRH
jgi:hypothetical protein